MNKEMEFKNIVAQYSKVASEEMNNEIRLQVVIEHGLEGSHLRIHDHDLSHFFLVLLHLVLQRGILIQFLRGELQ